jgi:hypothetical protein
MTGSMIAPVAVIGAWVDLVAVLNGVGLLFLRQSGQASEAGCRDDHGKSQQSPHISLLSSFLLGTATS